MNKKLLIGLFVFINSLAFAQTPVWTWSKSHSARINNNSNIASIKDASGNIYVCGEFEGTVNYGGVNTTALGFVDLYVSKFDQAGTLLWTKTYGGASNTMYPGGLAQDQAGNIYLSGSFSFAINIGFQTYLSAGNKDGYLIKIAPDGTHMWAKTFGSSGIEDCKSISSYGNNLYVVGGYFGSFNVDGTTLPTSTSNSFDAFVIAMDSSGTATWASHGGGAGEDYFKSVFVDQNAVYAGGYVTGSSTFGTYTLNTGGGANDIAFAKLSLTGTFTYAKRIGGASTDQVNAIGADNAGNIFIGGGFYATVNFGNSIILSETGAPNGANGDGYIAKFDPAGLCLWARKMGSSITDDGTNNISVSPNGYVYACGFYHGSVVLTSTVTPQVTLTTIGGMDGFYVKYNPSGSILWAIKAGNSNDDRAKVIVRDENGYCFALGIFYGNLVLGSLPAVTSSAVPNTTSTYIARLNGFTTGIVESKANINFSMFPNPSSGNVQIELPTGKFINEVEVFNVTGQRVFNSEFTLPMQKTSVDLNNLSPGIYLVKVLTPEGYVSKSLEIQ
ncbi:MAG TPA: T9SS type A sorting domain-containing protein [Bacteroidia bacterium]|nr:T9SS type A sorting domain-containing protein [Bacteroidia bacterium]